MKKLDSDVILVKFDQSEDKKYLCPECGQRVRVRVHMVRKEAHIKEEQISYLCHVAVCENCGENVPVKEFENENSVRPIQIYCQKHNLVTLEDINEVLRIYHVDKRQLPFIMNIGEHTLERYMKGQVPNVEVSKLLKGFLKDYRSFQKQYLANQSDFRLTDNARKKIGLALGRIEKLNVCKTKLDAAALYLINSGYEITNLALQKLLYYVEAVSLLKTRKNFYGQDCQAWVHGPVYPCIYERYKEFGRAQITDCGLNPDYIQLLSQEETQIIDYVINNFGIYNGKILERSTHREEPWRLLREGYLEDEPSNGTIPATVILKYFTDLREEYDLMKEQDVARYMQMAIAAN